MPPFSVTNNSDRRQPIRHDEGVIYLKPGETRDSLNFAPSLRRYYEGVPHFEFEGGPADDAEDSAGGGKSLDTMTTEELFKVADDEGVEFGEASTDAERVAIIRAFRELFVNNSVDELKAKADEENIDLDGARRKADIVNLIVKARGVSAAA